MMSHSVVLYDQCTPGPRSLSSVSFIVEQMLIIVTFDRLQYQVKQTG